MKMVGEISLSNQRAELQVNGQFQTLMIMTMYFFACLLLALFKLLFLLALLALVALLACF